MDQQPLKGGRRKAEERTLGRRSLFHLLFSAFRLSIAGPPRHGLSTLELVLALPILLFLMALMINYGTVCCWKIRGLSVARHATWSARWPRTPGQLPRPDYWPASATLAQQGDGNLEGLDDPRVDHPVARGPLPPAEVNWSLLDPTRGLRLGSAELERDFPLLPKLGPYQLHANHRLLDGKWQYQRMGLPGNTSRRIPVIYTLPKAGAAYLTRYVQAVTTLLASPLRVVLRPLDRDDELLAAGIHHDFHPRLQQFCSLDRDVARERVDDLVDHIQGSADRHISSVADEMIAFFTRFYQDQNR